MVDWLYSHPWDDIDILIMFASSMLCFFCKYKTRRDAVVGTALIISWWYQIYETTLGARNSAPSDALADMIIFLVLLSAGGNIMSVVVLDGIRGRWVLLKSMFRGKND